MVRGQDASDAAYERMKELAMMRRLREKEAAKAEEEEQERRYRDRQLRDERQRELAEIRKLNQQYEAAQQGNQMQPVTQHRDSGPSSREQELERARNRMAREAEEVRAVAAAIAAAVGEWDDDVLCD